MELTEVIEKSRIDKVHLTKGPRTPQAGSLALTGHHLIFSPYVNSDSSARNHDQELWLLHRTVDRAICEPLNKGANLTLKCKNLMICTFQIANIQDAESVARSIERLSNLTDVRLEYPFFYRTSFTILDNGWNAFDVEQEYSRLQVRSDQWRISHANRDFKLCPSYPETVIVPKGIGDDFLRASAKFRQDGRFPVLSYFHCETRSSILRCSQPLLAGNSGRRSREDEAILSAFLGVSNRGYIFDTRSQSVAAADREKGGGTEPQIYYPHWKYVHKPITCWDRLQESLMKLVEETSVLVHGNEGTDSTLLITSLAAILLDADARTIRGFQALIEREWIEAGHPFSLRCSHAAYATGSVTGPYEAPTFLCFLDCVWQIFQQYPLSFEFTEQFLIFLFEHAYSSEFGSFLGNCEKDKIDNGIKSATVSLWSFVNNPDVLQRYVNRLYEPRQGPIWPSVAPQSIEIWERLYFRWKRDWTNIDGLFDCIVEWKNKEKELRLKIRSLDRQLEDLFINEANSSNRTDEAWKLMNMIVDRPLGFYWDLENIQIGADCSALSLITTLRAEFGGHGAEMEFVVVCDVNKQRTDLIRQLNSAQVNVVHVGNIPGFSCKKIIQLLGKFACNYKRKGTVVVISGDTNLAFDLQNLRTNLHIKVILINGITHENSDCQNREFVDFLNSVDFHYDISDIIRNLPLLDDDEQHNYSLWHRCQLLVGNLPRMLDIRKIRDRLKQLIDNLGGKIVHLNKLSMEALIRFPGPDATIRAQKRLDQADVFGAKITIRKSFFRTEHRQSYLDKREHFSDKNEQQKSDENVEGYFLGINHRLARNAGQLDCEAEQPMDPLTERVLEVLIAQPSLSLPLSQLCPAYLDHHGVKLVPDNYNGDGIQQLIQGMANVVQVRPGHSPLVTMSEGRQRSIRAQQIFYIYMRRPDAEFSAGRFRREIQAAFGCWVDLKGLVAAFPEILELHPSNLPHSNQLSVHLTALQRFALRSRLVLLGGVNSGSWPDVPLTLFRAIFERRFQSPIEPSRFGFTSFISLIRAASHVLYIKGRSQTLTITINRNFLVAYLLHIASLKPLKADIIIPGRFDSLSPNPRPLLPCPSDDPPHKPARSSASQPSLPPRLLRKKQAEDLWKNGVIVVERSGIHSRPTNSRVLIDSSLGHFSNERQLANRKRPNCAKQKANKSVELVRNNSSSVSEVNDEWQSGQDQKGSALDIYRSGGQNRYLRSSSPVLISADEPVAKPAMKMTEIETDDMVFELSDTLESRFDSVLDTPSIPSVDPPSSSAPSTPPSALLPPGLFSHTLLPPRYFFVSVSTASSSSHCCCCHCYCCLFPSPLKDSGVCSWCNSSAEDEQINLKYKCVDKKHQLGRQVRSRLAIKFPIN